MRMTMAARLRGEHAAAVGEKHTRPGAQVAAASDARPIPSHQRCPWTGRPAWSALKPWLLQAGPAGEKLPPNTVDLTRWTRSIRWTHNGSVHSMGPAAGGPLDRLGVESRARLRRCPVTGQLGLEVLVMTRFLVNDDKILLKVKRGP